MTRVCFPMSQVGCRGQGARGWGAGDRWGDADVVPRAWVQGSVQGDPNTEVQPRGRGHKRLTRTRTHGDPSDPPDHWHPACRHVLWRS